MAINPPTPQDVKEIAAECGISLNDTLSEGYLAFMSSIFGQLNELLDAPEVLPPVKYPRAGGWVPPREENQLNAWYVRCSIKGAARGKLKGRTVAVKDNIMVAGVPMMNGTALLEGYVPEIDATVVTRLLDAGAEILGKAQCEDFCMSGGSHTSANGPVHNPHRMGYSAGGSSSGSAALVGAGEVDLALGCDQGGSIRMPSSLCGTYGMKPTFGLVPYTGILGWDTTIDHVGPITASVRDNALMLEVLAGDDGFDYRQHAPRMHAYTKGIEDGVRGIRIGIVKEGFGVPGVSDAEVDAKVRDAAKRFAKLGATVEETSIPQHLSHFVSYWPIFLDGAITRCFFEEGVTTGQKTLYVTSASERLAGWRARADELAHTVKAIMILGCYLRRKCGNRLYAKASNHRRRLREAYDAALGQFDLLAMPTTPVKASPHPAPDAPLEEYFGRAFETTFNTPATNNTGHPAMSIPCGTIDGLPVGLMLIGRHYDEPTIYRAAYAFEKAVDWRKT
jgi:amidase